MSQKRKRSKTRLAVPKPDFARLRALLTIAVLLVVGVLGYKLTQGTHAASNCTVSSTLVNSCRPWLGAAVAGYPQVSSDKKSQFEFAEQRLGRKMDIFHDYHPPGSLPLSSDEKYFATRPNTYIYVNWKPATDWASADGGNATVNSNIDKAAASIKSVTPHKIFLTIWHEPENDVSGGTSCAVKPGTAGTPAQYRAMWQNVENRFKADGVTNVVWVMNYMGYYKWDCLIPQMWPGNNLVDWVTYDVYSANDSSTVANTIGRLYNLLQSDDSASVNFDSKPWGAAEWGDCKTSDQAHVYQYYQQMKSALDANAYPRLKMYMAYDDNGNNAGMGCLTEYSKAGKYDPTEQSYFNKFANDQIFSASGSSSTPSGGGSSGSTVSGSVSIGGSEATVNVDGKPVATSSGKVDTTYLTNGQHTITTTTKGPNGSNLTTLRVVDVQNDLTTWQEARDFLLSSLRGHPALMNAAFWAGIAVVAITFVYLSYHFLMREPLYVTIQRKLGQK
jgi:hypothetical protein